MIRLLVHGAGGRMGRHVTALAESDQRFELIARFGRSSSSVATSDRDEYPNPAADAVVDFSSDAGASEAAQLASNSGAALLVGTTGLTAKTLDVLGVLARSQPVMIAPNTSRAVAVMNHLVGQAARLLGQQYEVDLIEQHRRGKLDAPSGTACRLLESISREAGIDVTPERVHCLRTGDVVGDHEVRFTGDGERLSFFHSALNRTVFAAGALDAMAWLVGREPGLYSIEQSLGLANPLTGRSQGGADP